jgi:hypothetical protein
MTSEFGKMWKEVLSQDLPERMEANGKPQLG